MTPGYHSKIFVSKPSHRFECPICCEILRDPLQCSNGHASCEACWFNVLEKHNKCPTCNTNISKDLLSKCLLLRQMIEELQTYCVSHDNCSVFEDINNECTSRLCDWQGPLHARTNHYQNDCGFNVGCEVQLLSKSILEHKEVCKFASVTCDKNNQSLMRNKMTEHNQSCQTVAVNEQEKLVDDIASDLATTTNANDTSITTVAKKSKKNAKKATKRRNNAVKVEDCVIVGSDVNGPTTCVDNKMKCLEVLSLTLQEIATINVDMSTNSALLNKSVATFTSTIMPFLTNCSDSDFYECMNALFITDANSYVNSQRTLLVKRFFDIISDSLFDSSLRAFHWLTHSVLSGF